MVGGRAAKGARGKKIKLMPLLCSAAARPGCFHFAVVRWTTRKGVEDGFRGLRRGWGGVKKLYQISTIRLAFLVFIKGGCSDFSEKVKVPSLFFEHGVAA